MFRNSWGLSGHVRLPVGWHFEPGNRSKQDAGGLGARCGCPKREETRAPQSSGYRRSPGTQIYTPKRAMIHPTRLHPLTTTVVYKCGTLAPLPTCPSQTASLPCHYTHAGYSIIQRFLYPAMKTPFPISYNIIHTTHPSFTTTPPLPFPPLLPLPHPHHPTHHPPPSPSPPPSKTPSTATPPPRSHSSYPPRPRGPRPTDSEC